MYTNVAVASVMAGVVETKSSVYCGRKTKNRKKKQRVTPCQS